MTQSRDPQSMPVGPAHHRRVLKQVRDLTGRTRALERKAAVPGGGGGGVSDHGALTGLADDDHTQYHTDARGDARYQPLDSDLTTIAALDSGTSSGVMATEASGWVKRTYAQIKTSLSLVKGDVGLGNVDNTADTAKPVSTAQQTALDLKAPLASPTFTGTPSLPTGTTGTTQTLSDSSTKLATTAFVKGQKLHDLATPTAATPMGGQKLTGLAAGTTAGDSVRYEQVVGVYQPIDTDLTTIAGLTATTDNFIQSKGSAWASRTVAQVITDLVAGGMITASTVSSTYAPKASPTFTGTVVIPAAAGSTSPYQKTEVDTLLTAKAPLASPTFTGTPAAPTAAGGTNTTQLATTAFVQQEAASFSASGISGTIGDAKGDLIGFSAADTPVKVAAAAGNGYVLTSDTSQTGGVKWQQPGIPVWNTIERGTGVYGGVTPAATYFLAGDKAIVANTSNMYGNPDMAFIRINAADYAVTGMTTQVRILTTLMQNATAPGVTIKGGLFVLSACNGASSGIVNITVSTEYASATVASGTGAQSAAGSAVSLPPDGHYVLCVTFSGTAAANSSGLIAVHLQMRHV